MTLPHTLCTAQNSSAKKSFSLDAPSPTVGRNFNLKVDAGNIYVNFSTSVTSAELKIVKYALTDQLASISDSDYQLSDYKGQVNLVIASQVRAWYQPPSPSNLLCESRFEIQVSLPVDWRDVVALNLVSRQGDIYVNGASNASISELNAETSAGNIHIACEGSCDMPLNVDGSPHLSTRSGNVTVHDVNVGGSFMTVNVQTGYVNMTNMLFVSDLSYSPGPVLSVDGELLTVNISDVNKASMSVNVGRGDINLFVKSNAVKDGYFNGRFDIKSGNGNVHIAGNDYTTDSKTDSRITGYIKSDAEGDGNMFAVLYTGNGDVSVKVDNPTAGASSLAQTFWLLSLVIAATMLLL